MSDTSLPSLNIDRAENAIFAQRRQGAANPADWTHHLNAAQVVLAYTQDFSRDQCTTLFEIHRATTAIGAARILDAAAAVFAERWRAGEEELQSLGFSYSALAAVGYAITGNFPAAQTVLNRALPFWPENAPRETALLVCAAPALLGKLYPRVVADATARELVDALAARLGGGPSGEPLAKAFDALREVLAEPFEQSLWMSVRAVLHQVENLGTAGLLRQRLPHRIHDVLHKIIQSGYHTLLPPQYLALRDSTLLTETSNALVCLPTSTGKTLLAELCVFSHVDHGKIGFYVVPYVALGRQVADKIAEHLAPGWTLLRLFGGYTEAIDLPSRNSKCIAVVTPERLDAALRSDAGLLERTSCIVIDEAHMIGSGERGVRLEGIIARLLIQQAKGQALKLVLLSAVVPNAESLQQWVGATPAGTITSQWTPNTKRLAIWSREGELTWYHSNDPLAPSGVKPTDRVATLTLPWPHSVFTRRSDFGITKFLEPANNDNLAFLLEYLSQRFQAPILCVCPTRDMTRKVAAAAAKRFPELNPLPEPLAALTDEIATKHPHLGHLAKALRCGVAFHNASLPHELRAGIEDAAKDCALKAVISTTTLAEGVDLPFRATVLADWLTYSDDHQVPLSSLLVRNIAGRAGRAGYFTEGDLILYDSPLGDQTYKAASQKGKFLEQVLFSQGDRGLVSPLVDTLGHASVRAALESQLLAAVDENGDDVQVEQTFWKHLFAARQAHNPDVWNLIRNATAEFEDPAWQLASRNSPLRLTELGRAVSRSGFSPRSSLAIKRALQKHTATQETLPLLCGLLEELGDLPEQHHDKFRKLVAHQKAHGPRSKVTKGRPRFCVKLADLPFVLEQWFADAKALAIFAKLPTNLQSSRSPSIEDWLAGSDEPCGWDDEFDKFCDFLNETIAEFLPWLMKACGLIAPFVAASPAGVDWETLARILKREDREEEETIPEGFLAYLRTLRGDALRSAVDDKIADAQQSILDDDVVSGLMAETNAMGFSVDDYHIESIDFDESGCRVTLSWHASGDQDEDRPYHGSKISGTAVAVIDDNGGVEFEEISGDIDRDDEPDEGDWPPEPGTRG